ncbi:MAG: signal peptide peptidase SppA, partial [Propionibacterium sp.]|nr:signal peptide peptidase SppA [Propionibacterium sp.]
REMTRSLVESLVTDAVTTIAGRRGITEGIVREAVESSPLTPARALEAGLVDHIGYRDEAYAAALDAWGADRDELRFVNRYQPKPDLGRALSSRGRKKIGVVPVRGPIVTGRGSAGLTGATVGSDVVDEHLRAALRDDDVVAVVLDVDSPGGSAVASDFIWRTVHQVRESGRPVVARMGGVAASGGYYVAMGADEIVALPSTLTGSIGVLGGKMVSQELYEKLGLVREIVAGTENTPMMNPAHRFTDEDWARLNAWLDRIYLDFTTKAAADRGMEYDQLESLAKGRVWTGVQALDHGLVDHLGGRRVAHERAAALAGVDVDDVDIVALSPTGLLARIMPAASSESVGAPGGARVAGPETLLKAALREFGVGVEGALSLPYRISIF